MNNAHMEKYCRLDPGSERLLRAAYSKFGLSARGVSRILKVARTIADLSGRENIAAADIAEAIQYKAKEFSE